MFFSQLLRSEAESKVKKNLGLFFQVLLASIFNMQAKARAFQIGERHYDLGNELFKNMLDNRMVCSCAYWKDARTLDAKRQASMMYSYLMPISIK